MHTPVEFYIKIPVDLFRGGTPTKPKFDYLRTTPPRTGHQVYDVKINPRTQMIDSTSGGLSLFDTPNFAFGPDWWVVPKGTPLPLGFTISKDLTEGTFKGHYTVRSLRDIHIETWKKTLREWAEEYAVHLDEYRSSKAK